MVDDDQQMHLDETSRDFIHFVGYLVLKSQGKVWKLSSKVPAVIQYSLSCIIAVFTVHCILIPLLCVYLVLAVLS